MKKSYLLPYILLVCASILSACSKMNNKNTLEVKTEDLILQKDGVVEEEMNKTYAYLKINEQKTYQTIESFGASGAWWSQYVGGWDQPYGDDTVPVREAIATLLYSREEGIGLSAYRYNVGAGSRDSMNGDISDINRRAESFEISPGIYDFNKDKNAVWFLKKVVELGASEITLFSNSPLERLTVNKKAHMTGKNEVNLLPDNYDEFANYIYDVAEHFIKEGIPVTYISPINEPQWDWLSGQEGCHYEPKEVVELLKTFLEEIDKRESLSTVQLSAPESGEWGGRTTEYNMAILKDEVLGQYFHTLDNHSYWTSKSTKEGYKRWKNLNYPDLKLRTSEWCEMVNGKDYTMDSAFNMAEVIHEDLTILDVVSWQGWVAVADGDYRDGLIYVNKDKKAYRDTRRLWALGNFSKYIRPGYVRVDITNNYSNLMNMKSVAFIGNNDMMEEELVIVLINREGEKEFKVDIIDSKEYNYYSMYTTSQEKNLEDLENGLYTEDTVLRIEPESITTIILAKKN